MKIPPSLGQVLGAARDGRPTEKYLKGGAGLRARRQEIFIFRCACQGMRVSLRCLKAGCN